MSDQIEKLLLQVEEEGNQYNWHQAIDLLKEIEQILVTNEVEELKGDIYYKMGEYYRIAADFEKERGQVLHKLKLSLQSFQNAYKIYKLDENSTKYIATRGFIDLLESIINVEGGKSGNRLEAAKGAFRRAKGIYQKGGQVVESLKMAILEIRASIFYIEDKIFRMEKSVDFHTLILEYINATLEIWNAIQATENLPEIYRYIFFVSAIEGSVGISVYSPIGKAYIEEFVLNSLKKTEHLIVNWKKSDRKLSLILINLINSLFNFVISVYFSPNQFQQKLYLKKALFSFQRAENLLLRENTFLIHVLYSVKITTVLGLNALGEFSKHTTRINEDIEKAFKYVTLIFPKNFMIQCLLMTTFNFTAGALVSSLPETQRIYFAQQNLANIKHFLVEISPAGDLEYKMLDLFKKSQLAVSHAIITLLTGLTEQTESFQVASKLFDDLSKYTYQELTTAHIAYIILLNTARTGMSLAEIASKAEEKIKFYQKTVDIFLQIRGDLFHIFNPENLFLIGDIYRELGKLRNDSLSFENASQAYNDVISYCKSKEFFNLVGSAYANLAQIEDRLGNYICASENYNYAIDYFEKAVKTLSLPHIIKKTEKLKQYMHAWRLIEIAKAFHKEETHQKAQINYERASQILSKLRDYKYESALYSAWGILEQAERLSKDYAHQDAKQTYLQAKESFETAIKVLSSFQKRKKEAKERDKIGKLIKVAEVRKKYCIARCQIETAKLESDRENFLHAAELYQKACHLFEELCTKFKLKHEIQELTAIIYMCKAWAYMQQAELEQKSSLYSQTSHQFQLASENFPKAHMKKLVLGNSMFFFALEYGSCFDNAKNFREKLKYYDKIKSCLTESAKNYQSGGFDPEAQWAIATSIYFDGIWQLYQANNAENVSEKQNNLNLATGSLETALKTFEVAGYQQKKAEIMELLETIRDERAVISTALQVMEKPEITSSRLGISAPACPIEISSAVDVEEMQSHDLQAESELNWLKRIHHLFVFFHDGTLIFEYSFKPERKVSPQLSSTEFSAIYKKIQDLIKNQPKLKIIDQGELIIIIEHGTYITGAILAEEKLVTIQKKLAQLIKHVETTYQEDLEIFPGTLENLSKIDELIRTFFQ